MKIVSLPGPKNPGVFKKGQLTEKAAFSTKGSEGEGLLFGTVRAAQALAGRAASIIGGGSVMPRKLHYELGEKNGK